MKLSPFELHFEIVFLESYSRLEQNERKNIDKAVRLLSANPRHPSLHVHKAKNIKGKYAEGGETDYFGLCFRKVHHPVASTFPSSPVRLAFALTNFLCTSVISP